MILGVANIILANQGMPAASPAVVLAIASAAPAIAKMILGDQRTDLGVATIALANQGMPAASPAVVLAIASAALAIAKMILEMVVWM